MIWRWLADAVLLAHAALVLFVIGGWLAVVVGNLRGWDRVNTLAFRGLHLAAIAVVVAQAWLGIACPLTRLEMWLRERAEQATYPGGFIEHWVERLLYHDAPPWVFVLAYTLFFALVLATWWRWPPLRRGARKRHHGSARVSESTEPASGAGS